MAEMMFALGQTKKKKKEETRVRQTKADLKDVVITDTIEKNIRKDQFDRDQKWKATGRDQVKRNNKFDMARSLFGGTSAMEREGDEPAAAPPAAVKKTAARQEVQEESDEESVSVSEEEVEEVESEEEEEEVSERAEEEYEEEESSSDEEK